MKAKFHYKRNMVFWDRMIRFPLGVLLLGLAAAGVASPFWAAVLALLGFFQIATGLTRYCPLFDLVGRPRRDQLP